MSRHEVSAQVISCPGRLGDMVYHALQVNVEDFSSPYVLTLALPRVCCTALSEQIDPDRLYQALAAAISIGRVNVSSRETESVETASYAVAAKNSPTRGRVKLPPAAGVSVAELV